MRCSSTVRQMQACKVVHSLAYHCRLGSERDTVPKGRLCAVPNAAIRVLAQCLTKSYRENSVETNRSIDLKFTPDLKTRYYYLTGMV